MKTWFGDWFSSSTGDPVEASVLASEKHLMIAFRNADGHNIRIKWEMNDLQVSFDNSMQATKIRSVQSREGELFINGKDALNFIQQMQAELNKPWHQKDRTKEWARNLLVFLGIAGVLVTAYFLIVPWLSEKMASQVSVQTEEQFGNAVYDALDLAMKEDTAATAVLNEFFTTMKVETPYQVKITVVKSEEVNAFALPGGNIVVYTGLLNKLKSYPELAALLSHEFIHVNNKHSTKSIFRQLGSRVFLSLLLGKFGSVTSIMIDQADQFKSLKYSRALEKEADTDGLALLQERKIDPEGFANLFQRLKASAPVSAMPEFLASHPDIENRIAYIQEASKNSAVEENSGLKSIFEKIK